MRVGSHDNDALSCSQINRNLRMYERSFIYCFSSSDSPATNYGWFYLMASYWSDKYPIRIMKDKILVLFADH